MNLIPANIGAEPKKLAILGGLLLAAGIVYFFNREPSGPTAEAHSSPLAITAVDKTVRPGVPSAPRPASRGGARPVVDFKPSLKPPDGLDISKIDPTLKLDLLAKLNGVPLDLGSRGSVFDWGKAPPPPPPPPVKITPGQIAAAAAANAAKNAPPAATGPPPTPPPPPIPLKFFGYSTHTGTKRAFFLNGDDEIDIAAENEVINNRYKVIKIGINSVTMEDLNFKHEQTIPLIQELAG